MDVGEPAVEERPRWGLGDAAAGLVLGLVIPAFVATGWAVATGQDDTTELSLAGFLLIQTSLWAAYLAPVLWAVRYKGARLVDDFRLRITTRDLLAVPVGLVAQFLVVLPYVIFDVESVERRTEELADRVPDWGVLSLTLIVVVGAPIVEELFFRGLLLRALERRSSQIVALGVSAAIFAATHYDPVSFPGLVAAGMLFGYMVQRTGRLGPAIVAHAAFNSPAILTFLAER